MAEFKPLEEVRNAMPYLIPNAAARAYIYNAAGVDKMTNRDFRPDEIAQMNEAWRNSQQGRQNAPIAVTPDNYSGYNVATTAGSIAKPIYNMVVNPMRMTVGSAYVSPEGNLLHVKDGNYYYGDVYDFSPRVQGNKEYAKTYQTLQNIGTKVRGNKAPMMIELNLKNKGMPTGGAAPIENGVTTDMLQKAWNKRVTNKDLKNYGRRLRDINLEKIYTGQIRDPINQAQVENMVRSGMFGDYTKW
jgi:hypothetical protein